MQFEQVPDINGFFIWKASLTVYQQDTEFLFLHKQEEKNKEKILTVLSASGKFYCNKVTNWKISSEAKTITFNSFVFSAYISKVFTGTVKHVFYTYNVKPQLWTYFAIYYLKTNLY